MITDETIREYEAQLEAEWKELSEQYFDALEQGYSPDMEAIHAAQRFNLAKFEALKDLNKIELDKLRKSA